VGNFRQLPGQSLFFFVLFLNGIRERLRRDASVFGINFPEWRVALDAFVKTRLGDRGIVYFRCARGGDSRRDPRLHRNKFGAIFRGKPPDAHDGVGIFRVDVEDGNALAARDAGSVTRRMFLRGPRGEANQVVNNDVDAAADRCTRRDRQGSGFPPQMPWPANAASPCITIVQDFIDHRLRAIELRSLGAMTRQFWRVRGPWPRDPRLPRWLGFETRWMLTFLPAEVV